ncbi:AlkZ-related protein [Tumebacillus permanentifrigoris]|uniref:Uncharacterized protein n=1 Tax=Tumebacillus permanentifrigoris TaxID=378543 RepID=A0A316D991_9BACL|nr:hypothetical protein [Tumebacillus permanentifrigoris]PWK07921.1 hypothetical protein C7459_11680 [Tumebacillus permanentifrigoris]
MIATVVHTYEQVSETIREVGILPLSSFIPEHPSLESITPKDAWHTGAETDPWLWRDRVAGEGVAAYGRFFKKKPILVSLELYPYLQAVLRDELTVEERYADGKLSHAAKKVYEAVAADGGIDTKALRKVVGMQDKDSKNDYDKALVELQESGDLVIAGIAERLNDQGQKNGWNSTCYELADRWLEQKGSAVRELSREEAKAHLFTHLEQVCTEPALAFFRKLFK